MSVDCSLYVRRHSLTMGKIGSNVGVISMRIKSVELFVSALLWIVSVYLPVAQANINDDSKETRTYPKTSIFGLM